MRKARVDFELAATKWDLGVPRKEDLRREFWEKWAGELSVLFPADLSLGEGAVAIRAMVDQWRRDAIDKLMLKVREARQEEMGPSTAVRRENEISFFPGRARGTYAVNFRADAEAWLVRRPPPVGKEDREEGDREKEGKER